MYHAISAPTRVASLSRNPAVLVARRRLATESTQSQPVLKRKNRYVRKIILTTLGLSGTFYVGSTFVAFYNQPYYDFFSERVAFGQSMLDFAETHGWDTITVGEALESGKQLLYSTQKLVTDILNGTRSTPEPVSSAKRTPDKKVQEVISSSVAVASMPEIKPHKVEGEKSVAIGPAVQVGRHSQDGSAFQFSGELADLVKKAEAAIEGKLDLLQIPVQSLSSEHTPRSKDAKITGTVYEVPLPIGFEPPPGYSRSLPKETTVTRIPSKSPVIPLIAPSVSSLSATEPVIAHLAEAIDNLSRLVTSDPSASVQVSDILQTAKSDLTSLVGRIEKAREEERCSLESRLDEQTREYTLKLMELEMAAQDKLDYQEQDFRALFDEEKIKMAKTYREKLESELRTQTEIINERLKQEVIAQGIELQRRWVREIKIRVEQERGGRLGKLEDLASKLKQLERVTLDNSIYLDENIRAHNLWSVVRTLTWSALSSPVRKPFRNELRVLRHVASAREDPVVAAALESLDSSETPDIGVEPLADLATWFTTDVAPKVCQVALVPEQNAGVLSYLASHMLSGLRFRRHGLVKGDDVLSVVSRAEYHLNEKDLDSAARELNQLRGPASLLLRDWLEAARRRLEVEQALEVIHAQATLTSILIV